MKKTLVLMAFCYSYVSAQKLPAFNTLRYDENYALLSNDSADNWYRKSKYTAISKSRHTYISFGGDIRYQYFNIKNEEWGTAPKDKDGFLFSRLLLHADMHAGKHIRSFVQLQSSMANGKTFTSPVDEDPMELHQAFIDYSPATSEKTNLLFRLGRQEMLYGSQRLVAVRDGPNNRQSFDAVKAVFKKGTYKADLFFSHFVRAKKELYNDGSDNAVQFWGAYIVKNHIPLLQNIDLYYFGLKKARSVYDDGVGSELRHSVGARIWNNNKNIKYDIEGLYQFGSFDQKKISAWTLSFNCAYKCNDAKLKPEFGLKTELISGDAGYGDNKLGTFNPLFPRGGYFGLASLIGPSNLFDIHPSLALELAKRLAWNIDYDAFWRYSRKDGIYAPSVAVIFSGKTNTYKTIGQQLSTDLVFAPNNYVYFRAEFTWFMAGNFLKYASPGKDILFTGITSQLKF